ncbi:hypothetical protein [Liquorilactobacillus nagelii]|jgi:hypothetical protein|uniref:hypothetical protein n=1 Tax=Liquorilactobacillus nagelii TaxID=82688 RepID=UPI0007093A17|nr:hypothetical protein [Liquorilactobacillus nagelii]QYH53680.1 hypothetical protein G6O73_02780 [Liquorilactobacillus nagelii DSM 13675]
MNNAKIIIKTVRETFESPWFQKDDDFLRGIDAIKAYIKGNIFSRRNKILYITINDQTISFLRKDFVELKIIDEVGVEK